MKKIIWPEKLKGCACKSIEEDEQGGVCGNCLANIMHDACRKAYEEAEEKPNENLKPPTYDRVTEGYDPSKTKKEYTPKKPEKVERWRPEFRDIYWTLSNYSLSDKQIMKSIWNGDNGDMYRLDRGLVFRTKEEAQKLADRLNEVIRGWRG